jgi:serine/threonine-protein kinase ULK4
MNNYSLTEEIGRGNYSIVYKGRKKKTIEYYAIKSVVSPNKKKNQSIIPLIEDS